MDDERDLTGLRAALRELQKMAEMGTVKLARTAGEWMQQHQTDIQVIREQIEHGRARQLIDLSEQIRARLPTYFGESGAEFHTALRQALDMSRRLTDALGSLTYCDLVEQFRKLPERTKQALIELGNRGWYLDPSHHQFFELAGLLADADAADLEESMISYYSERLDEIEKSLIEAFPERASILGPGFAAHRRGEYVLSVLVFLAQADGIAKHRFEDHYFLKERGKGGRPRTAAYVDRTAGDAFREALMVPLVTVFPIAQSQGERGVGFSHLNRHLVMHGESLDYGTMANSLKALSLLQYVAAVPMRDEDDTSDRTEA
jgi:hypothetical protein